MPNPATGGMRLGEHAIKGGEKFRFGVQAAVELLQQQCDRFEGGERLAPGFVAQPAIARRMLWVERQPRAV